MLFSSLSLWNNQNIKWEYNRIQSPQHVRLQGVKFSGVSFSFPGPRQALDSLCSHGQTFLWALSVICGPSWKCIRVPSEYFDYHRPPLLWAHTHIWHTQTHFLSLPSVSALFAHPKSPGVLEWLSTSLCCPFVHGVAIKWSSWELRKCTGFIKI